MRYQGNIVRPPSESSSYILQVTIGCSYTDCAHCDINLADKTFQIRPIEEVFEDINMARHIRSQTERVFLADGNALVLETERLSQILDALSEAFHALERVGTYARPEDVLDKSVEELHLLKEKKLGIIYLCFGSGSDEVLRRIEVDVRVDEIIAAAEKVQEVGFDLVLTAVIGLGGEKLSQEHIQKTAEVINQIGPDYLSMMTLTLARGSKLHQEWLSGEFNLLYPRHTLLEMRQLIELLDESNRFELNTKHASNYIKLRGIMPKDKEAFLNQIDSALKEGTGKLQSRYGHLAEGSFISKKHLT
jgi:radical SAM superfamily enzyme YgiQ (UPF0313 family)